MSGLGLRRSQQRPMKVVDNIAGSFSQMTLMLHFPNKNTLPTQGDAHMDECHRIKFDLAFIVQLCLKAESKFIWHSMAESERNNDYFTQKSFSVYF